MRHRTTAALLSIVCIVALSAGPVASAQSQAGDGQTYAVTQGDQCIELQPLGNGSQSVEEFYDYRTPETHEYPDYRYSSYGTQELQRDDTTTMFVYEGSEGTSLVVLHDRLEGDTAGGAVTMQFDDLAEDSEWAVQDDTYNGTRPGGNLDEWQHNGTSARATWAYTDSRNDGGALRGFGDNVTITPYFNDAADFREYEGNITDWQVVSAEDGGYNRTSLNSMDEEVTVRTGGCASLSVADLTTSPDEPGTGEDVEIRGTVTNDGGEADTFTVEITVDGEVVDTREVSLDAGESTEITASTTFEEAGPHEVSIAGTTTSVRVAKSGSGPVADVLPGFGPAVAIVGLLGAAAVALRRR